MHENKLRIRANYELKMKNYKFELLLLLQQINFPFKTFTILRF